MIIPEKETLTVEFKSDRARLPDNELVETAVGMTNTDGGDIYLGIEDDGTPTGLHDQHLDVSILPALIANRTIPPLGVRVEAVPVGDLMVARIAVPPSRNLVGTASGKMLRRRLLADGKPETVGMSPLELTQRLSTLHIVDPSSQPLADAMLADFDPLERERLRQIIRKYNGEKSLLDLLDDDLDGVLGFVTEVDGIRRPTLAGLLCLGYTSSLRRLIPSHEAAFQVLQGTEVRYNPSFLRDPLLKLIEHFLDLFNARNNEQEIQVGLFRVPIPDFDPRAFREALINAFTHRDYARIGTVQLQLTDDALTISNPGGFVEGVTLDNLLTVRPTPRNPVLADALKRIGLAERTGRGVDRIYEGMLRYGRPAPSYAASTATSVVVNLPRVSADLDFMAMVRREEERAGHDLPVESLIVLARLREGRRLDIGELAAAMQRPEIPARAVVERLVESGLLEAHGATRGRTYMLSAQVYQVSGDRAGYVRQAGFDAIQREQMVMKYVKVHGRITRREVMELCRVSNDVAFRLLRKLVKAKSLEKQGATRGAVYTQPRD